MTKKTIINNRGGFTFYRSWFEAVKGLPLENQANYYNAIFNYIFNDTLDDLKGIENNLFVLIKPHLEINKKQFGNGLKGGRPVKTNKIIDLQNNPNITQQEPNRNPKNKDIRSKNKEVRSKNTKKEKKEKNVYTSILEKWNICASRYNLANINTINNTRKNKLDSRLAEGFDIDDITKKIDNSDYLKGKIKDWKITFDWLITNDNNWTKVVEGNYADKNSTEASELSKKITNKFKVVN